MSIKNFKDEVIEIIDKQLKEYEDKELHANSLNEEFLYISNQGALVDLKSKILHLYMDKYMKGGDK